MVGVEGFEPTIPYRWCVLSALCMPFHHTPIHTTI